MVGARLEVPARQDVQALFRFAPSYILPPGHQPTIEIIRPKPGERLVEYVTISGKTSPKATVRIRIEYTNNLPGILRLSGTVLEDEVVADASGAFSLGPIRLGGVLQSKGLEFTIIAVARDSTGMESPPATVKAMGRKS